MSEKKIEALKLKVKEDRKNQQKLSDYLTTQHEKQRAQKNVDISIKTLLETSIALVDRGEQIIKTHEEASKEFDSQLISKMQCFREVMEEEARKSYRDVVATSNRQISAIHKAGIAKYEEQYSNLEASCSALQDTSYEIRQQQRETQRANEQIKNDIFLKKLIFKSATSVISMCCLAFVFCFSLFLAVFSAEALVQHASIAYVLAGFMCSCLVVFLYLFAMSDYIANKFRSY